MITQLIEFDVKKDSHVKITAKEGDINSRYLEFRLLDNSLPFSLVGRTVRCYMVKPDKRIVFNDLQILDAEDGRCVLKLSPQSLIVSGMAKLELIIYEAGKKLSVIPIKMDIIKSLNSNELLESTNEFGALNDALWKIDTFKASIDSKASKEDLKKLSSQLDNNVQQLTEKINEVATTGTTTEAIQNKVSEMAQSGVITFDTVKPEMTTFINAEVYPNLYKNTKGYYDGKVLADVGVITDDTNAITLKDYITIETNANYIASYNGKPFTLCARVFKGDTDIENYYGLPATRKTNIAPNEVMTTSDTQYKYLFISIYKGTLTDFNVTIEEFLKGFAIQKSSEIKPLSKYELKEDIKIPKLEELEKKLDNLTLNNSLNLLKDLTIRDNMGVANVGWCYDKTGYMTFTSGIQIEEGKTYAFGYGDSVLRVDEILIKSANDLDYYVQDTVVLHSTQKVFFTAPNNSKYLYFTIPNNLDKNKVRVYEGYSAMDLIFNTSLKGKNIMTLGDSLSAEGMWQSYVVGRLGINKLVNLAIGGKTVSEFAVNVTAENIKDIDVVIIMGFFNSNTLGCVAGEVTDEPSNVDTASICSGYKYIIDKLYKLKPNLDIVLITPHRPLANDCKDKADKVKELAEYYSIPCIDIYNEGGFNNYTIPHLLYDGIHCNIGEHDGYYVEGRFITGQLIKYFG